MSHETHGEQTFSPPPAGALFSPEEVQTLRAADVQAAKSVVLLMVGVFSMGLVLYAIVALSIVY
jgi:hypothetical protein